MSLLHHRVTASLLGLALPGLLAVAGLGATAPIEGARAQEAAPAAAEDAPSRGQRRGRGRHSRTEKPEAAAKSTALPPGMQQATPVVTFGDWNVFTNGQQGKARVCYAIAQPQTRSPKTLARDTAYLFVTIRKGENIQNEIAVMFGFKPKPAAAQMKPGASAAKTDPYIAFGNTRFGLVVKDENAWVQNQAEEARIVSEMGKSQTATVRTISMRGKPTNDEYALGGFADAVKRAREECK
ncbi:invasion associated locus b family protein [Methylobacterium gnaphalii]|uniref:Invasion associated locus b family protein n=1 Tax=Methylobacterium gnaphalii TaxID=1010610 RepID=A0A512JHY6_9HYPH|nr:invasion associated locus b family protein [Methylobacterium gnaphalii]GEP09546.1 hypothetical protein MGN01_13910 [Methylobacterium gnaphalii]GJD69935.1 hypothetical protein MMMDOFMJ_2874 [Methylobacterium gnaphalii]GLS48156.1 hypothetical protein GCM10007885_10000 [Methylobacterium gnaphalii]